MAFAVVEKEPRPSPDSIDEQVQIAVAVHVDQHCAGGKLPLTTNPGPGLVSHVLKAPVAQVAVKHIMIFQTAQIDVTETVAIDIAQGKTRSIESNLILGSSGIAQDVCEVNGCFAGRHKGKARLASAWNTQRG